VSPEQTFDAGLSPLEFSAQNFESIVAFYHDRKHNKIYKGRDAVKQNLEQEGSRHAVLCFVTHAQALDNDPLNSYLVLAGKSFEDGLLKVPDIACLELHTDLVILAACETGRGHITGDGVNGLGRAFLSAGTASLLLSLWSISERETMQQLYLFHDAWRNSEVSKALALQRVQIERIHTYQREQPDVWAGLVLMGEAI
jgi:CHAT domain-containing protein